MTPTREAARLLKLRNLDLAHRRRMIALQRLVRSRGFSAERARALADVTRAHVLALRALHDLGL